LPVPELVDLSSPVRRVRRSPEPRHQSCGNCLFPNPSTPSPLWDPDSNAFDAPADHLRPLAGHDAVTHSRPTSQASIFAAPRLHVAPIRPLPAVAAYQSGNVPDLLALPLGGTAKHNASTGAWLTGRHTAQHRSALSFSFQQLLSGQPHRSCSCAGCELRTGNRSLAEHANTALLHITSCH
jgi:hypothetical protein